jgi:hypothetical protein
MLRFSALAGSALCGLGLLMGVAACGDADTVDLETPPCVTVSLRVAPPTPASPTDVRATSPLDPDRENFIYDLWVLQFVVDGHITQLATDRVQHLRVDAEGTATVTGQAAQLYALPSYVCVIANRNYQQPQATFADIFDAGTDTEACQQFDVFSLQAVTLDLAAINAGEVDKVLMSGYWKGTPTDGQTLNIQLGRMLARLNVTITNSTGAAIKNLTSTLSNAATRTLLYPTLDAADWAQIDPAMTTLTDKIGTLKASASTTLYYYVAPNYCADAAQSTKLTLTNGNKTTEAIVLGTDAPGTTSRDLNLYYNTQYNFTVTLTE